MRWVGWTAALAALALAVPAFGQRPDSLGYDLMMDLRFGGSVESTSRIVALVPGSITRTRASLKAAELLARTPEGLGMAVRYERGDFPAAPYTTVGERFQMLDGAVLIGGHAFSVVPGYQLRWFSLEQRNRQLNMWRLGFDAGRRSEAIGIAVRVAGSYLHTPSADKRDSLEADGIDGETHITYAPPRVPIYIDLGYRRETLALSRASTVFRREEFSKVMIGVGLQYGLSAR